MEFGINNGFGVVAWSYAFKITGGRISVQRYRGSQIDDVFWVTRTKEIEAELKKIQESTDERKHDFFEALYHRLKQENNIRIQADIDSKKYS